MIGKTDFKKVCDAKTLNMKWENLLTPVFLKCFLPLSKTLHPRPVLPSSVYLDSPRFSKDVLCIRFTMKVTKTELDGKQVPVNKMRLTIVVIEIYYRGTEDERKT